MVSLEMINDYVGMMASGSALRPGDRRELNSPWILCSQDVPAHLHLLVLSFKHFEGPAASLDLQ